MRMLTVSAGVALLILAAGPAFAGDPGGGGQAGGGHPGGGCGSSCGGGGHPGGGYGGGGYPGGGHPGGGPRGGNVNINVNANANANANASAGASARSSLNARTYDAGGIRGGGSYGAVYVGGGYGGDGGYYGGQAFYGEVDESRICASAPFGYVVTGFGREGRQAPTCLGGGQGGGCDRDRGGRYGYSEPHGCRRATRRDSGTHYEESSSYESYESVEEYGSQSGGYREVEYGSGGHDSGGSRDCGCRHDDRDAAPYPPRYTPEPEPSYPPARPYRPRREPAPRPSYRQEPGERG